jgi:hypothetical protein
MRYMRPALIVLLSHNFGARLSDGVYGNAAGNRDGKKWYDVAEEVERKKIDDCTCAIRP